MTTPAISHHLALPWLALAILACLAGCGDGGREIAVSVFGDVELGSEEATR